MESFRERISRLSPQRLTLIALELQEKVDTLENAGREAIAVIGMACRLPGGAATPAEFWNNLKHGRDALDAISEERWSLSGFDPSAISDPAAKWGALLPSVEMFDPGFFNISPSEAAAMDPQQRLLLEVCWEAIENAGIAADSLSESNTGVFVGMSSSDYAILASAGPSGELNKYTITGAANSIAVGRISYLLGLQGPNMAVDTSCSSSATAVHLACQSLRRGECDLALAGGVHLALLPQINQTLARFNMLAADGRCKTFSDAADGFARGEGCGVLLLKRLSDAMRDQDNILGIIQGSACNQDGRTGGLTAPNGLAQERVISTALKDARMTAEDIDFIEAHGTGTALGDPIELNALARVFPATRLGDRPLAIGSVKTNIGHLEAAAGVAGLIKVLLALEHQEIPPTLHSEPPNTRIPWDTLPFKVARERFAWRRGSRKRAAGISSFGYSGTNVHIVVQEFLPPGDAPRETLPALRIVTASAKTRQGLMNLCRRYANYLESHPGTPLVDFARTVNQGRTHFPHRCAAVAASVEEARKFYAGIASGAPQAGIEYRFLSQRREPEIVFMFPGSNDGYAAPARFFYETSDVFREAFERCEHALQGRLRQQLLLSLEQANRGPAWSGERQAAQFSFQYALYELWRSWGIRPSAVAGDGAGEFAAACAAGVFGPEDGVLLALLHGEAVGAATTDGQGSPMASPEFDRAAARLLYSPPCAAFISGITGKPFGAGETPGADYWTRRLRGETHAGSTAEAIASLAPNKILEVTCPPIGAGSSRGPWESPVSASLRPGEESWARLLETLRSLYLAGAPLDWKAAQNNQPGPRLVLPNYPFERQRYWLDLNGRAKSSPSQPGALTEEPASEDNSWTYEIAWEPVDEVKLAKDQGKSTSIVAQIMASMTPTLEDAASRMDYSFLPQFRLEADALSVQFILEALEKNGLHLEPGAQIPADLCGHLGISRKYDRLLGRVFSILGEEGILLPQGPGWIVHRQPTRRDTEQEVRRLRLAYPQAAAELNVLERAAHLGDILKGRRSGLEILFPDGSLDLAEGLYQTGFHARLMNPLIAELARKSIDHLPAGRRLRILELGAGTGGATAHILPLLPRGQVEYFFTDVSKVFLAGAARKFAGFQFLRYAIHDIESSGVMAGEEPGSFDLVIAANVLHATKSVRATLANVRNLLAPGGFLLLLEAARSERLADITLGTLEGWWRFDDLDLRQSSALIGPELWQKLLAEAGFSSALLPAEPDPGGVAAAEPAILARLEPGLEATMTGQEPAAARHVLLLSPMDQRARSMANELRRHDLTVTHVIAGDRYERLAEDVVSVPFADKSAYSRLLEESFDEGRNSVEVVCLGAFLPETQARSVATVALDAQRIASGALLLIQSVLTCSRPVASVWFATSGAQASSLDCSALANSVLTGLVRVLASEHASLNCRSIDGDPGTADKSLSVIAGIIAGRRGADEPELAIRDGKVLAPRLRRAPLPAYRPLKANSPREERGGAYLITGAFGALGMLIMRWLAEPRDGVLFLFGRNHPSSVASSAIEEARRMGVEIAIVVGDVSDEDDVSHLFDRIAGTGMPLRGIFHLAATLEDSTALHLSEEALARVLAPKVMGSWLLHQYSRDLDLDYFVLFSSAASVLGTPGQSNYAMGNTFMDALAHCRQNSRLPGASIDWGPWAMSGANVKRDFLENWRAAGGEPIAERPGLEILGRIIQSQKIQIAVLPVDWSALSASLGRRAPHAILKSLVQPAGPRPVASASRTADLKLQIDREPFPAKANVVADYMERRLIELLGLDADTSIPLDMPFLQLGFDSLMSLELKNEIQDAVRTALPPSLFFDYPTRRELNKYFEMIFHAEQLRKPAVPGDRDYEVIRI